jgi:AcrR family transcriptional regulator
MGRPKELNRQDILDKAIAVFWKHGLAETSVQDLERATGVNKSGIYTEFESKEELFVESLRRYFSVLQDRAPLMEQPLGWSNIEQFLKLCHGSWGCWGQKGCFSVNSMREFSDLPREARELMIGSVTQLRRQLIRNLSASRPGRRDNGLLADLIITFFCGISVEQNLAPSERKTAVKIDQFMRVLRAM